MAWLLDTNVWIFYLKNPAGPVRSRLEQKRPCDILSCSVVRAELMHGSLKYANALRRQTIVRETLAPYTSLPFDDAAAEKYALVRQDLESTGSLIGPYDLQLAAICLANGLILVTNNLSEFGRVNGLALEDWTLPLSP